MDAKYTIKYYLSNKKELLFYEYFTKNPDFSII